MQGGSHILERNRGRSSLTEDCRCVEQVVQSAGGIVHPVAVQIAAAATEVIVAQLAPGHGAVDIVEVTQAGVVEDLELLVVHGVLLNARHVGAVGIEDDITEGTALEATGNRLKPCG